MKECSFNDLDYIAYRQHTKKTIDIAYDNNILRIKSLQYNYNFFITKENLKKNIIAIAILS